MKKIYSFLFCLLVIFIGHTQAQSKKIVADKIIAVVGDRIILQSDIKNSISDIIRQGGTVPADAECGIFEQAIVSKVLMLQAEKDSLVVGEDEIEAELDQRIRYFINQYGSQDVLEEVAGKTIYKIKDEARESVKERKYADAMQRKIVENVKVTPNEVKAFYESIPKDSLPFFESQLEIGQIIVYPKASRDFEKYIMDEMNNYKRQIESKVTTFEILAKRYSEDPGSKDRGGQYQVNRNEKTWDPAFLTGAFRLKDGEISSPIKSKFGYHLIQMVERKGDDAIVRHILRIPPVTAEETAMAISKIDSVRAMLIAGTKEFGEAAAKYSEDENIKFAGAYITGRDGSTYVTIDELGKDIIPVLNKLKIGEYSQPNEFTDDKGKKGVRLVYLKSRSEPHRMNVKDDYNKLSQMVMEEKKFNALEKWISKKLPAYYIRVDDEMLNCKGVQKFGAVSDKAAF